MVGCVWVDGLEHRNAWWCSSETMRFILKFMVPLTCLLSRKSFGGILQNVKVCDSCCRLFGLQLVSGLAGMVVCLGYFQ